MTKRKDLYHAVFAFLTAVAEHPALMVLLLEQRPTKKGSSGLQALGEEANRKVLKVDASSAGLNLSLLACGQKTSQHAKAFAGLTENGIIKQNAQSGDTKEAIDLCRALFRFTSAARETAPAAYEALILVPKDNWKTFREMNKVTFTDDVLDGHMYLEPLLLQSEFSQFGEAPIGRMRRLHEELATLKTSL
jgi:baculoviral IAP repeat-containing protein 6